MHPGKGPRLQRPANVASDSRLDQASGRPRKCPSTPIAAPLSLARGITYAVATPLALGLLLFWPAGTFAWPLGWLFLIVTLTLTLVAMIWLLRVNPAIFAARSGFKPGTKSWDKVLATLLILCFVAILPVAGLDTVRFGGAVAPVWVIVLGYMLYITGFEIMAWAQGVNPFFEPGVRIQPDRDQTVIDAGPYATVRHPGYASAAPLMIGIALVLGSWWALVPAIAAQAVLVVRTVWEDRLLKAELPGYADYARRVPWRLVPRIW